jgi:hypothetical protein
MINIFTDHDDRKNLRKQARNVNIDLRLSHWEIDTLWDNDSDV